MLHAVAELAQHLVRHVDRVLRDEEHADALGADQAHDLLDPVEQRLRRVVEQQMRLVEEENELRLVEIADFRQLLEQLRQQPQQERRVEPRALHQLVGDQDVDGAAAVAAGTHQVLQLQRRLAEELGAALVLQHQKLALDGADRGLGDIAVLRGQFVGVLGEEGQHGAHVLEVEQQQPLLVGDAERDVEHALLHVVEVHHPRQQQRPHLGDGGAHRMTLLAEHVPEHGGKFVGLVGEAHVLGALDQRILGLADRGDARQIALDVGGEHRHAGPRQAFSEDLQRNGLAGAGCAGDEAVAIGKCQRKQGRSCRPCRRKSCRLDRHQPLANSVNMALGPTALVTMKAYNGPCIIACNLDFGATAGRSFERRSVSFNPGSKIMTRIAIAIVLTMAATSAYADSCKATAGEKKLAGAALTSFMKKCESDAKKACDTSAADKKLHGAAQTSFTKKCVTDAVGS